MPNIIDKKKPRMNIHEIVEIRKRNAEGRLVKKNAPSLSHVKQCNCGSGR